jgi:putative ABC transport system permease protein
MLALRLVGAYLRAQPLRVLLAVLGIALGVATVVAIFTLDANTIAARLHARAGDAVRADLQATLSATAGKPDRETREVLAALPGVARTGSAAFTAARACVLGSAGARVPLELIGIAGEVEAFGGYDTQSGASFGDAWDAPRPEALVPLLIGETLARERGWKVGSVLELSAPPLSLEPLRRCEDGRWVEEAAPTGGGRYGEPTPVACEVVGVLRRWRLGARAEGRVAILPFEVAPRVRGVPALDRVIWIQRAPGADVAELRAAVRAALPDAAVDSAVTAAIGEEPDERAFRNGVRVAGVLALVLGLFVIFHALSIALLQRMRTIAILIALGLTRGAIARLFLLEAALIAGVGAALGALLGLALAKGLLVSGLTTLGVVEGGVQLFLVPWRQVATLALLGFALALAGAAHPLWRSRSWSPDLILRTRDLPAGRGVFERVDLFFAAVLLVCIPLVYFFTIEVIGRDAERVLVVFLGGLAAFALILAALHLAPWLLGALIRAALWPWRRLLPLETELVGRSMSGLFGRVVVGVGGLALVSAALVALRGMTESLRGEVRAFAASALEAKLFVTLAPQDEQDPASIAEFRGRPLEGAWLRDWCAAQPEVLGYEIASLRLDAPFPIRALPPEQARWGLLAEREDLRARFADAQQPALLISRRLAAFEPELLRRGTIALPARTRSGAIEVRVLGVCDDYGIFQTERSFGVMAPEFFRLFQCMDPEQIGAFTLKLREDAAAAAVAERLARELGGRFGVRWKTGEEKLAFELADIDRDFFLFDVILALVAVLAGLGLLHSLWIAALERQREIAILKAVGFTPQQVRVLFGLEALTTGALGGIFGVLLGVPLLWVVVRGLRALSGLELPFALPWPWLGAAALLGAALGLAAGLLPALRASRLAPAPQLRGE